jgi:hypothetical protein
MAELLLSVLNVHDISNVRKIEIHTAKPLVPDPRPFEVETAATLKKYKSLVSNQILAELIQADETLQKPRSDQSF